MYIHLLCIELNYKNIIQILDHTELFENTFIYLLYIGRECVDVSVCSDLYQLPDR